MPQTKDGGWVLDDRSVNTPIYTQANNPKKKKKTGKK